MPSFCTVKSNISVYRDFFSLKIVIDISMKNKVLTKTNYLSNIIIILDIRITNLAMPSAK